MRAHLIIIISLISITIYSQKIEFGNYQLCYDMYWRCHFQNLLELKSDSTYEFTYLDDVRSESTQGNWKIDSNFVLLTPFVIPDTIKIMSVYETSNESYKQNIISISESYKDIPKLKVNCFFNGNIKTLETDSVGEIQYDGKVLDSLTFTIKNRELKIIPKKKVIPSIIRININTNYKDLVYRELGINKIIIQNGKMVVKYRDGETCELKTEYFEKIK